MPTRAYIQDPERGDWLRFSRPTRIVTAHCVKEVLPTLQTIESAVERDGLWAAGWIAYEAAPAFDEALTVRPPATDGVPLLAFGLFPAPERVPLPAPAQAAEDTIRPAAPQGAWQASVDPPAYEAAIRAIKDAIAAGATYQVNYTFRLNRAFADDPWPLFLRLARDRHCRHGAYIETDRHTIVSASPELFFRLEGNHLTCRPMKGTAPRGRTLAEDDACRDALAACPKNRAENAMIVDMIRNDLGRVCRYGSVHVTDRFACERYPTLWQMTSTVEGESDASLRDILRALFPCASITGAPKAKTMEIIAGLETRPRGLYTGTIGYLSPDRQACFNVAIRTVVIDHESRQASYGVGGGVVWDSTAEGEYDECRLKAELLQTDAPRFELLETLLWTPSEGFVLLERHLARLRNSAVYFDYAFDESAIRDALESAVAPLESPHRVRLLLDPDGSSTVQVFPFAPEDDAAPVRLRLASHPVNSQDVFLYHKTTHRDVYATARAACDDCDDVLLYNEHGEITETTIANIAIQQDNIWVTPPVSSGLLGGTLRAELLERGALTEHVVTRDAICNAKAVHVLNSVRGRRPAVLID